MFLTNVDLLVMDVEAAYWRAGFGGPIAQHIVSFAGLYDIDDEDPQYIAQMLHNRAKRLTPWP